MATKTNAVRIVQQAGISCREAFYDFDENDLNGNHAAQAIGFPPEQVFKTLVVRGQRTGIHVFCIPVCCELDLIKDNWQESGPRSGYSSGNNCRASSPGRGRAVIQPCSLTPVSRERG